MAIDIIAALVTNCKLVIEGKDQDLYYLFRWSNQKQHYTYGNDDNAEKAEQARERSQLGSTCGGIVKKECAKNQDEYAKEFFS